MKKILLTIFIFIFSIINVSAFQLLDTKKELDFIKSNNINSISYTLSQFNKKCDSKCNVEFKVEEDKVILKGDEKEVNEIYLFLKENKETQKVHFNINRNQEAFFNILEKKELQNKLKIASGTILFFIIFILLQIFVHKKGIKGIMTIISLVIVAIVIIFKILPLNSEINDIKNDNIIYGSYSNENNNIYTFSKYVIDKDINVYSEEELKLRQDLDYYYSDILISDINGNPIKELSNKNKIVLKENISKVYKTIFNISPSKISAFYTDYGIIIRVHKHHIKENIKKVGNVALAVGLIYARHKVTSSFIGNRVTSSNQLGHAFNNIITLSLTSDLLIYLQGDKKIINLPN